MGFLSHRVDHPDQIKPGDHIYTWRAAFTYSHHGIYVGGNMVVHFTAPETPNSGSGWNLSSSSTFLNSMNGRLSQPEIGQDCDSGKCLSAHYCGFKRSNSGVMASCFKCFIGTGSPYLYQYEVNNFEYFFKLRGGTCTMKASDPPEDVISRAIHLLHNGFGDYSVFKNNCEDFALYCKTGLLISGNPTTGGSGQVNYFYNAPWKTIASSAIMASTSAVLGATLFAVAVPVRTVFKRYTKDIGVRDDVVKVKVEDVGSFRGFKKPVNELDGHDDDTSCTC